MSGLINRETYTKKAYISDMIFSSVILILVAFVFFITNFWLSTVEVNQSSMTYTLYEGDVLILNELKKPDYGEIVVFDNPERGKEDSLLIKRIIAMGGDTVYAKDEVVYLKKKGDNNFTPLDEFSGRLGYKIRTDTRVIGQDIYSFDKVEIPEGCIFVLGDNRYRSNDSRMFGVVDEKTVKGVVTDFWVKRKNLTTKIYGKN